MAVTLTYSNVTIRGITYSKGSSFKCYSAQSGNGGSEGNASSASALTVGTTYYFHAKATGDNVVYPYAISTTSGGSVKGWYKEAIFPYATYSVAYNPNGGSGAPDTQTKTYGTNLTLSSTKPTRTGYTFQGWGTSSSDTSVDYAAGATYSKNAAITLYAIWKANTYTISYNANGGSGAPSSQTKTYGVNLKLSSTKPTRTNYEFLGWSTNKNASTATYSAGGTFTTNAATTLYAIWKLKYVLPTITNLKAIRCDSNGNPDDFGTYAKVTFNWSCSQLTGTNNVSSITVNGTAVTAAEGATGTSGSVSKVIGGSLSIETTHTITVKVIDTLKSSGSGTTTKTTTVPAAVFAIDFLAGGKGVGIGKPATEQNLLDIQFKTKLNGGLDMVKLAAGTDLNDVKVANFYSCLATNQYTNAPPFKSTATFLLEVYYPGQGAQVVQRAVACDTAGYFVAVRCYYASSGWGTWNTKIRGIGVSGTWIAGRDNALLATTNTPTSNQYFAITSAKTTNGAWTTGVYNDDKYYITYTPDTDYNRGSNTNYVHGMIIEPNGDVTFPGYVVADRMKISNPDSDTYYNAQAGDYSMSFGIGSGKVNRGIYDHTNSHWMLYSDASNTYLHSTGQIAFKGLRNGSHAELRLSTATGGGATRLCLYPASTSEGGYLGNSSYKFTSVYATTSTIQTSDRNQKENIRDIDPKYVELFSRLRPVTYELKGSNHDRVHIGFIAQEIKEAMDDLGITAMEFAAYCEDVKIEYNEETGEEVKVLDENGEPIKIYSLRYEEFIALNTLVIQNQQNKINDLESRLAKLEALLGVD